jgi:hypothetical protein
MIGVKIFTHIASRQNVDILVGVFGQEGDSVETFLFSAAGWI